ncbi:Amuc_1102 family pilus-like protein [Haloferula sargassicola]|uniref:Uncharacterized protein n=1 Tax=Haloferula sargassicola TaxID=490096 RepID=A0ABP9ULC5_9BACT
MKPDLFPSSKPLLAMALAAVFGLAGMAQAQRAKADVAEPTFDALPSPQFEGTKNKSFKPKDWLEVEAGITIPAMSREQDEIGFIDEVTVKWYVAVKDKATRKNVLLTTDLNHINVPVGEEFYSSVYISPNTLKRLTGADRASKGAIEVVALEVLVNGQKVGEATTKFDSGWWNAGSLSRTDQFPLLNKYQTPFKNFWWDRYAEIEEER